MSQRGDGEHESSRRIKTEFLVQLDGIANKNSSDNILIVAATNRPHEIDEAARRRFTKRLLIPLPDNLARKEQLNCMLVGQTNSLSDENIEVCRTFFI